MNLTTPDKVKQSSRSISKNIENERIERCIIEAEQLYIKPRIGDALYIDLLKYVNAEEIEQATFPKEYKMLLSGGNYKAIVCGEKESRMFMGLEEALNYYVYAKLIKNFDYNVTRFGGAMVKRDDYSERADIKEKLTMEKDALHTADIYMDDCLLFLKTKKVPLFRFGRAKNRLKIQVIGE